MKIQTTVIEIESAFRSLSAERGDGDEIVAKALQISGIYLAVNSRGDFLCLVEDDSPADTPARRLRSLSVDYGLRYRAKVGLDEIVGNFTVLKLDSRNTELLNPFATMLEILTARFGDSPSAAELKGLVETFIELFAPRIGDPRERIKGLFGELTTIIRSGAPELAAKAWHESTNANRDFSYPHAFLEVKTTEGKTRKHAVSENQLVAQAGKQVFLISLLIEEDPQGKTVFQLLDSAKSLVAMESLQIKLNEQVLSTLGLDTEDAHELKFALVGGMEAIWVFESTSLPFPVRGNDNVSSAISGISYTLNLEILEAAGVRHTPFDEVSINFARI